MGHGGAIMFIDYVTLLLVNMSAGLFVLAIFLLTDLDKEDQRRWCPAFAIVALIAIAGGAHMTISWPLPGSFNMAFGEASIFFGSVYAGAALATGLRMRLGAVALYALAAGAVGVVLGVRIIDLGVTMKPTLSGLGFIFAGMGGVFAYPVYRLRSVRFLRVIGAIVMLAAAAIWAATGFTAYWSHMASFADYVPPPITAPQTK